MCKPNFPFLEREFLLRNKGKHRTCPGGPVVETPHSQCRGPGSAPGWGTRSCMLELRACMWPQGCGTDQKKEKRERENYQAGLPGAHHTYLWQEHWSGLPFTSPGNLPDPEIKPVSPALAGRFFTTEPAGKPKGMEYAYI